MFFSRKPTRLPNYDYSSNNYYFITICTQNKACIFGTTKELNCFGMIAKEDLQCISEHYACVTVDNYIVMPNHVHAIIVIQNENEEKRVSLSQIIGQYKSGVSRKIKQISPDTEVWQRSFHDHIIRNQAEYEKIWNYVEFNASKWEEDCFYIKE